MKPVIIIAIAVVLLFPTTNYSYAEEKIPDWVKNIFLWYAEEEISEDQLLGALQYLIEIKILTVESVEQEKFLDKGDFKLIFQKSDNPAFQNHENFLKPIFTDSLKDLNSTFSLPYDIGIKFKECGFENAYYSSSNRELVMCYELLEELRILNSSLSDSNETGFVNLLGQILFIYIHEIGHVLVDVYDLPITGNEEDAVDQFSAIFFLDDEKQNAEVIVASASVLFGNMGAEKLKGLNFQFWDEHSFELKRFYNLTCLFYGNDPIGSTYLTNNVLPKERADRCPAEYEQADKSWEVLLAPYLK